MQRNLVYIGIAGLAVIAVVLGYQIYKQQTGTKTPTVGQTPNITVPQGVGSQQGGQSDTTAPKVQLKFLSTNPSEQDFKDFYSQAQKYGVEGNKMEFINCEPTPQVLKVPFGSEFDIVNKDNTQTTIIIDKTYTLTANSSQKIDTQTIRANAAYGIRCGKTGSEAPFTGVLYIP